MKEKFVKPALKWVSQKSSLLLSLGELWPRPTHGLWDELYDLLKTVKYFLIQNMFGDGALSQQEDGSYESLFNNIMLHLYDSHPTFESHDL